MWKSRTQILFKKLRTKRELALHSITLNLIQFKKA